MRKVIFTINDDLYLRDDLKRQNPKITQEQIDNIMVNLPCFRAVFTLYGSERSHLADHYELLTESGETNVNKLNGYQRGIVINECYQYFEGKINNPFGVIKIEELTI